MRELLFQGFRHGVDEMQERTGWRAFSFVERGAGFTLAVAEPIVGRHRHHGGLGLFAQAFLRAADVFRQHLFVGQAQLRLFVFAFAVDQAEPFGVRFEFFFRIDYAKKRMDPVMILMLAPMLGLHLHVATIALVAGGPIAFEGVEPKAFSICKGRRVTPSHGGHGQIGIARNLLRPRRPPPAAGVVFQKGVRGVQGSASALPCQEDVTVALFDDNSIRPQIGDSKGRIDLLCGDASDNDVRL